MKKFLILLLIPSLLLAEDNVLFLNKGQQAPHEGFLFSREAERQLRLTDLELKQSKDIIKLHEEKAVILQQRVELRDKEIDSLSKRVIEEKDNSMFTKVGFFILGAVITGGIAVGVSRLK